MADTLVEFLNSTRNYTQLTAGVPIVTNLATEQAVVRDIELTNPTNYPFKYTSGGNTLITSSGNLTGTEIVGASSSLVMTTTAIASGNTFYIPSAGSFNTYTHSTIFNSTPSSISGSTVNTSYTTSLTVQPYFMCFGANGDFYYSESQGSGLNSVYRRAGGINGTESVVLNAGGTAPAFDGRYLSGFAGNALQVYDTSNNTFLGTTNIGNLPNVDGQKAAVASIDGYLFIRPQYDGSINLIRLSDRTWLGNFGTDIFPTPTTNLRANMTVGKSSSGNYYMMLGLDDNYTVRFATFGIPLGNNLEAISLTSSSRFTLSTNSLVPRVGYTVNRFFSTPNRLFSYALAGSSLFVCNWDTLTLSQVAYSGLSANDTAGPFIAVNSTKAVTDFGNIGIRATGIKTTP